MRRYPVGQKKGNQKGASVTHSHLEAGSQWFQTSPWDSGVPQSSSAAASSHQLPALSLLWVTETPPVGLPALLHVSLCPDCWTILLLLLPLTCPLLLPGREGLILQPLYYRPAPSNVVTTAQVSLVSTWNVASTTDGSHFFVLINLNRNYKSDIQFSCWKICKDVWNNPGCESTLSTASFRKYK